MNSERYRIGFGEDAHRLEAGRPLIIGGVKIPSSPHGAAAHSDGDALLHALSDALLSAFALGDIGHYFPPSDPAFKNMESAKILARVLELLNEREEKPEIVNVAAVVTLDEPKLGTHRAAIAADCGTFRLAARPRRRRVQDQRRSCACAHPGARHGALEGFS